ncbi:MAG: I78 family peptidase inhibitor [Albidovulum sp.]
MRTANAAALAAALAAACMRTPPDDGCGAGALSGLVSMPVSAFKGTGAGRTVRILYPDSARTEDYSAARLNIEVGHDGIISSLWCG